MASNPNVFHYFVDNIWSGVINETITAIFEISQSSWDRRIKSDLSKVKVYKYIENT